jgi:YfiH family protein
LKQTHSNVIHVMTDTSAANTPFQGDAAVTELRGALLAVQTADCAPILIADKNARVVAAVHAGWRGTAAHIADRTVRRIQETFSIAPSDLIAVIGPHNAVCCYEVGTDVVDAFNDPNVFQKKPEWAKAHLDQGLANKKQLMQAGIPESQISVSTLCTQCRADLFFSYRREGKRAGRLLSIIGLTP